MKKCSCCNEEKPRDAFQARKASKDGLTSSCKACLKARDAKRYPKERERRAELSKRYARSEKGKASHKASVEKWRTLNANRRAAHTILNNALRKGTVCRHACFVCGGNAEAHHPDYDRPLDVVWLCSRHHKEAHKLTRGDEVRVEIVRDEDFNPPF